MSYIGIIITFVFINNFILTQFLGLCPFIGVSKNVESAVGMGFAVTFVMALASISTWVIYNYVLIPLDIVFLQTITFILVIAALVQFVELVIQKISPALYKALGILSLVEVGGQRSHNLLLARQMLCQLSYSPVNVYLRMDLQRSRSTI